MSSNDLPDPWRSGAATPTSTAVAEPPVLRQVESVAESRRRVPITSVPVADGWLVGASFVSCRPKNVFEEGAYDPNRQRQQETDNDGVPKWSVTVNFLLAPNKYGRQDTPQMTMTIASPKDPAESFAWNDAVTFQNLKFGVTFKKEGGVSVWLGADAILSATGSRSAAA